MLLVKSSCPCSTILVGAGEHIRRWERGDIDAHHEPDGEHKAAEDFDDPRIARGQPCYPALEDF